MSKILKFADGTSLEVTDESSISCLQKTGIENFAAVDDIKTKFTVENLTGATFDDVSLSNIIPVSISAKTEGETITATITNRAKTHDEIVDEQITELQEAAIN